MDRSELQLSCFRSGILFIWDGVGGKAASLVWLWEGLQLSDSDASGLDFRISPLNLCILRISDVKAFIVYGIWSSWQRICVLVLLVSYHLHIPFMVYILFSIEMELRASSAVKTDCQNQRRGTLCSVFKNSSVSLGFGS